MGPLPAFIALTVLIVLACSVSVCYESGVLAFLALVVYLGLSYWFGAIDPAWLQEHYMGLLVSIPMYIAIGGLWVVFYWYRYVVRRLAEYKAIKVEWETSKSTKTLQDYWQNRMPFADWIVPPLVSKHRALLMRVWAYWPFSIIEYTLTKVVKEVWNSIYAHLSHVLQQISDNIWKDA